LSYLPNLDDVCIKSEDGRDITLNDLIDEDKFEYFGPDVHTMQLEVTPLVVTLAALTNNIEESLYSSESKDVLKRRVTKLLQYISEESNLATAQA
jgi:CO dehydrogenase/acetyl-CoA synthase beta subunit